MTGAGEGSWVVTGKVGRRGAAVNLGSKCCLQTEISHDVLKFRSAKKHSSSAPHIIGPNGDCWTLGEGGGLGAGFVPYVFEMKECSGPKY